MIADIVIGFLIAAYCAYVIYKLVREQKDGGHCTGCTGSCTGCKKCSSEYFDKLIREADEKKMIHG